MTSEHEPTDAAKTDASPAIGEKFVVQYAEDASVGFIQVQVGLMTGHLRQLGLNSTHGINTLVRWKSGTKQVEVDVGYLSQDGRTQLVQALLKDGRQIILGDQSNAPAA